MKKKIVVLLSAFLLLMILAACQSEEAEGDSNEVTLELWNNLASGSTFFPKLIEEFEAENPGIKIELNNVNVESSDAEYQAAISDNSLPDMFITDAFSMNELVDLDLVHELNSVFPEEAQEEYTEGVFDEGNTRIGDNIYLFPIFKGGTYMMYYNKAVLEELGIDTVPETWDELLAVGKEVYEKSDGNTEGLIFGGTSGWLVDAFVQLMATELSPESRMDYVNGEYSFNNEGNVETIEFLKKMLDENALSRLTLETNSTVAREYFAVGRTAFLIDGNWTGQLLEDENEFSDWGVVQLPTKNPDGKQYGEFGVSSNDGMFVSNNTEHWDEVEKFLIFLRDNMYEELVNVGEATIAKEFDLVDGEAPFEQIDDIQDIFSTVSIQVPNSLTVNPEALDVQLEVLKNGPDSSPGEILMGYLTGQVSDLEGELESYESAYNKAFDDALEAHESVTREDFQFPDWVPYEPYTEEDHQ